MAKKLAALLGKFMMPDLLLLTTGRKTFVGCTSGFAQGATK
jgi:hypothetical protein